jgi:AGCS family alanine or glycine:cation symporter
VPFIGVAFILVVLTITLMKLSIVPAMLYGIIISAFGLQEAGAGILGAAIKNSIQRGLYSNEAFASSVLLLRAQGLSLIIRLPKATCKC